MKGEREDDGLMGTFAATGVTFLNPAFRKTFASFLTRNEQADCEKRVNYCYEYIYLLNLIYLYGLSHQKKNMGHARPNIPGNGSDSNSNPLFLALSYPVHQYHHYKSRKI